MSDDLNDNQEAEEKRAKNEPFKGTEGRRFDSEYQPSPEAKSMGWKRRMGLREMLKLSTAELRNKKGEPYRDLVAIALDMNPEDVTLEMIMDFRQIEKASKRTDSYAYKVVKEFAHGKARQIPEEPPPPTPDSDQDQKSTFDFGEGMIFQV